jgi:hypothetical protein
MDARNYPPLLLYSDTVLTRRDGSQAQAVPSSSLLHTLNSQIQFHEVIQCFVLSVCSLFEERKFMMIMLFTSLCSFTRYIRCSKLLMYLNKM